MKRNGEAVTINVDGRPIPARPGQTILEACEDAGIWVPRLCWLKGLTPAGSCRVCIVRVNGRVQSACTQPVAPGMFVENDTEELRGMRRDLIDMLFVEGNHYCMFCEKSGDCELQALAYRLGITAPKFPYLFPKRELDATHPDVLVERNRCILCSRCIRASAEVDERRAFGFVGRGFAKHVAVDSTAGLGSTDVRVTDKAVEACPTGSLLPKRSGYRTPVGHRRFDERPIGSEVEDPNGSE